jgi:hypothetical protein
VNIACEDWGAFSTMEATAPGCVPLTEHLGKVIGPVSREAAQKTIPRDEHSPLNQIADAWEETVPRHGTLPRFPLATEDADGSPVGNGFAGDGLSAYEEYRGFTSMDNHIRTSPDFKNLFIHDRDSLGFGNYPRASGVTCYPISETEYDANRVINFNRGHANVVEQHGLLLIDSDSVENGATGHTPGIGGPPKNHPAVNIRRSAFVTVSRRVMVGPRGITLRNPDGTPKMQNLSTTDQVGLDQTITHELGHGTGMRHHGNLWSETFGSYAFEPTAANPAFCGCTVATKFPVRRKGNNNSGDQFCYMRYANDATPGSPAVYEFGDGYECLSNDPVSAMNRFCTGSAGTGINAGGHMAGNATVGNCAAQLVINDSYEE